MSSCLTNACASEPNENIKKLKLKKSEFRELLENSKVKSEIRKEFELLEILIDTVLINTSDTNDRIFKMLDQLKNEVKVDQVKNKVNESEENKSKIINNKGNNQIENKYSRNNVLIVKSPNGTIDDENYKEIKKSFAKILKDTPVNSIKKTKGGRVVINFPEDSYTEKAKNMLNESNIDMDIKKTEKIQPKLIVNNVSTEIADNDVISHIIQKNPEIKQLTDDGHKIEMIFSRKCDEDNKAIYLKVDKDIRNVIRSNKGFIYIGLSRCKTYDHYYVIQCFKCQRFGHKANQCKNEESNCLYCSEPHDSKNCKNKKDISKYKCKNCLEGKETDIHHTSNYHKCPTYVREIQRIQSKTDL